MPAMYMNSSVTRCCAPPLPELAKSILPGSFFAAAISSFTEFTPSEGCTTSTYGPVAMRITGAKSASVSYGIVLYTCGAITKGEAVRGGVGPSGVALGTQAGPLLPPAPGPVSTEDCCPAGPPGLRATV